MSARKEVGTNPNKGATKELDKICDKLRHAVKCKESTSYNKRVDVFKGKKLLRTMMEKLEFEEGEDGEREALRTATDLMHRGYFFVCKKNPKDERLNKVVPAPQLSQFDVKAKYVWTYEGDQSQRNILLAVIIVGFTSACMFPIWPAPLKVGLWYVSVTLLLFMLGFITVRGIIFICSWLVGYELWIFPNLFDEELSVCDSFKPTYTLEPSEPGQMWSRLLVGALIVAFVAWVATQPTQFDRYIYVQKELINDLYSGKLLNDRAQSDIDKMDTVKVPTVEDLLKDEEEEDPNMPLDKEKRIDPEDGGAYDLVDFVEEYGGSVENPPKQWLEAPIAASNDDLDDIMQDVIDSDPLADETTAR